MTVLLLETIHDEALELLQERVRVVTGYDADSLRRVLETEQPIQAIVTRGKGQIDAALLDACPAVQVVARCGVGLDNVDVAAATARGVRVVNAPGANAGTVAEHALLLMLLLVRNGYESVRQVREGNWAWRAGYQGDELSGKTLGILGRGNIGNRVARLAEAFGMRVLTWDRSGSGTGFPLDELLGTADVVSLHVPLTPETTKLIGPTEFSRMKPGAYLLNTARAGLVDAEALLAALDAGTLGGYAADVPPAPDERLMRHPRAILTPHVSSLTATTYRQMCLSTVQNVLAVLAGAEPQPESVFNRRALAEKSVA
jgi:phosphoglycerate dehydrogenase-like enzyme